MRLRYREVMPPRRENANSSRSRPMRAATQWSRTALALGLLFATLPLAGRLLLGSWGFSDATLLALLCLLAAGYLQLRARRFRQAPDPAALLDRSLQLAASGRARDAIGVLTEAIRANPELWQAYQYRGELYLQSGLAEAAIEDFAQAVAIAPEESHIRVLLGEAKRGSPPDQAILP